MEPPHEHRNPKPGSGLGWIVLLVLCCAGVPLLATGIGVGVLGGLFSHTGIAVIGGLVLMILGGGLLWWQRHK